MDPLHLGCTLLKIPFVYHAMGIVGYFGHGSIGVPVGLGLLGIGFLRQNRRFKQAGLAVLVSIAAAGLLIELLKHIFEAPRPRSYGSYGFPSGHSGAAFALATSLSIAFPTLTPVYFLLATMTAVSRLYFRAHFLIDVLVGGFVGACTAFVITRSIVTTVVSSRPASVLHRLAWLAVGAAAFSGVAFFYVIETEVRSYRISESANQTAAPGMISFDFGTPAVRSLLRSGWSFDEVWNEGKQSVVWAEGFHAQMQALFPAATAYRWRLYLYPYTGRGPACRVVEVVVNKNPAVKMLLEQGWHWYEFDVPKGVIQSGSNDIEFVFNFSESPKSQRGHADTRLLSVAFDLLEAVPQSAGRQDSPAR